MKRQSFLKGSAVLITAVLITKILGIIYKVPLTSLLGGIGMSYYSGAFAVFTPVFAAAAGGIPNAVSRLTAEQTALGAYKNAVRIRKTAQTMYTLISLAFTVLLILTSDKLACNVIHIPKSAPALVAIALSLVPAALMNVRRGWSEGMGSMTQTAVSEIMETAGKLVFGLLGAYMVVHFAFKSFEQYHGCFGKYCKDKQAALIIASPYAAAASVLGVSIASFAACFFLYVTTRLDIKAYESKISKTELTLTRFECIKRLFKFSVPASLTAVVATLAGMADLVTITPALDSAMNCDSSLFSFLEQFEITSQDRAGFVYGSYTGLALMIFGLLPTFTAMLGKSVIPSLTAARARNDMAEIQKSVRSLLLISSAIAIPGGLGIFILSKPILRLFFNSSTAEIAVSYKPLAVLGIAVVFMGIALPCLTALQACDKQLAAVVIMLVGTLIKLALNIVLIPNPKFNICGAAISTVVSQAFICITAVTVFILSSGVGKVAVKSLFKPIFPSLLCSCAAYLSQRFIEINFGGAILRYGVVFSITIGAIICVVSFVLLCISPKKEILSVFSKKITKNP